MQIDEGCTMFYIFLYKQQRPLYNVINNPQIFKIKEYTTITTVYRVYGDIILTKSTYKIIVFLLSFFILIELKRKYKFFDSDLYLQVPIILPWCFRNLWDRRRSVNKRQESYTLVTEYRVLPTTSRFVVSVQGPSYFLFLLFRDECQKIPLKHPQSVLQR